MRIKRMLCALLALCLTLSLLPVSALAVEGDSTSGTFTAAAMNVDGLPVKLYGITLNEGGPGGDGTQAISAKLAAMNWDIIGVSEDFNYNDELMSSLSANYNSGTHRGGVSWLTNNTDGLNLIWKKSISATGESWTSWNTHYGNLTNGNDGMIDKGYRYYEVQVAEGVCVDVYILHMDADSDQGDIDARHSQLTQLANAIKASDNGNPIIVMGDTNCRYTREELKKLFIDEINTDERFTIQDTWIEKVWGGTYPNLGEDALVAVDKGGTYQYPQAEIVDKIFYINNTESKVTLTANSYTVATDFTDAEGNALADHWPIVVEFAYSVKQEEHEHSYTSQVTKEPTCTEPGEKTYTCAEGDDSYTETIPALGHNYVETSRTEATCGQDGSVIYTCSRCRDSYSEGIPATGEHTYKDGVCTVCGEPDPNGGTGGEEETGTYTLGDAVTEVESGKQYAIVYPSSTPYVLSHEDSDPSALKEFEAETGDEISADMVWTVSVNNAGNYLISAQVDGKTQYLARTKSRSSGGYKITLQDSKYAWRIQDQDEGMFRISSQVGSSSYYALRPYTLSTGWITSVKVANVRLYEIEEG